MKNFNTVADRLQFLCSHFKMTHADLCRELNGEVSRATVGNIIRGRNNPSTKFINSLVKHMPQVNINWLVTGLGSMFNPIPGDATVLDDPDGIPIFPGNIKASHIEDPEQGVNYPRYEVPVNSACDFMIYASSSAMSPTVKRDDLVFCAKAELDLLFNYKKICLVAVGDTLLLRRIEKTEDGFRLVSTHSSYEDIELSAEEISAVYYVNECLRRI